MPPNATAGSRGIIGTLLLAALTSVPASAQVWTDWTAMTTGSPGAAEGVLPMPGGDVAVTYAGQLLPGSQTTCGTAWLADTYPAYDGNGTAGTYTPPLPCDMIQVSSTGTFSFTFSQPVRDLFMAFVSVGQLPVPVNYAFSAPFSIIDVGAGPWGSGTLTALPGNTLEGREGHGVVRFAGVHSSLEFEVLNVENWHGFTVGALPTTTVPEPATVVLLGSGLLGLGLVARRRRNQERERLS